MLLTEHLWGKCAILRRQPGTHVSARAAGKDKFNWEDVKNAPDREYYLGHSVKASAGRWQKGAAPCAARGQ